jgi:hypothetical protein
MNPSPFDIGRQVGNNFNKVREQGDIESILSEAMQSQDPQVLQNSIGKILSQVSPERQGPAIQFLQNTAQNIQQRQEKQKQQQAAQKYGIDTNLPPNLQLQQFKNQQPTKKTQASQPIDSDQLNIIKNIRESDEYKNASPLKKYQILTDSGVSKENSKAESDIASKESEIDQKSFESGYKANEDFINETTSKYSAFESELKPKLLQMKNIKDEDLISPTSSVFLEKLGIPLGALEDPSSELYQKLSQDLLKGLPEIYGNRILKVEVDNFLKTIPTLSNSPEGRRMISSNLLKLGEMKEVYFNAMRQAQKQALESNKFPRDFQQQVFEQVKPQIDRINNQFVKLSEIKAVPSGTIPFFNPNGEIEFVPKEHAQWASENGGKRIW